MEIFILVILVCAAILVGISYRIRKNKKHTGEIHSSVGKMDYRRGDSIPPKPAGETAYVFIDVETTGLNPNDDTIVQLSAVRYFGEKAVDGINTYIDPGRPIPAEATHIHGITDDIVRGAPKIGDVREPFMALIRDAVLVGYNTIFDLNFLNTAFSAYLDVPTVDIKNPRNALTDLQVGKLTQLAAAGEPWADTALMLCYTGFRVSELLALTRFAYHADGDYLQGGGKTKAGQDRIIPVHPKIKPYLMAWLDRGGDTIICDDDGHSIAPYRYRTYFKAIAEKIGAPQVTPHWCRHTFSTRLYTAGVEMLTIKWLMGHSTRQDITAHYTHSKIDLLQAAVLRLA